MELLKPLRKIETYVYAIVSGNTENLPEPRTRMETYLKQLAENPISGPQGPKGDKGDTGPMGPKGDKGETGAAGKGVKEISLTKNNEGVITGGTVTFSDLTTSAITITTTTV